MQGLVSGPKHALLYRKLFCKLVAGLYFGVCITCTWCFHDVHASMSSSRVTCKADH